MEIKKKSLKIVLGLNALLLSTISLAAPPPLFITFYKPNYNGEFVGVPEIITNTWLTCTGGSNAVWSKITGHPLVATISTPVSNGSPTYGYQSPPSLLLSFPQSNTCIPGASAASINGASPANATIQDNTLTYPTSGTPLTFAITGLSPSINFTYNHNYYTWRGCQQFTGDTGSVNCCFDTDNASCPH